MLPYFWRTNPFRSDLRFKITETNAFPTFVSVVDEIFEDGQINWGRIVAVYTFAARLAQHCKESCPDCDERISLYAGKYVANKLGRWILDKSSRTVLLIVLQYLLDGFLSSFS
jgi:hypothetical protein